MRMMASLGDISQDKSLRLKVLSHVSHALFDSYRKKD